MVKMHRKLISLTCAAALTVCLVPVGVSLAADSPSVDSAANAECSDNSIIIVYAPDTSGSLSVQSTEQAIPGASETLLTSNAGDACGAAALVTLPDDVSVQDALDIANSNPAVAFAQPNYHYYLLDDDPDPSAFVDDPAALVDQDTKASPNQWWLYDVGAFDAWQYARTQGEVTVAVLDTGIEFEHEDLADNILADYAYDAYKRQKLTESPRNDEFGHGTHVAGIVAGVANNGIGVAGVSYNANVLPICVFHEGSDYMGRTKAVSDDATLIRAYDYLLSDPDGDGRSIAQETNTRVINMSLGGYEGEDVLFERKIAQAEAAGILTVAAAGNDGTTAASYPSDYEEVMSVTAINSDGTIAYFSDHNSAKDIAAPGTRIYSTWLSNGYEWEDGTSMASPLVAGCAALIWSYYPELTVAQVKEAIYSTADDLGSEGFDTYFGHGRINPTAALRSLGLVTVTPEREEMLCASQQQLSASADFDTAEHTWLWTVDDPTLARVSEDGVLVALAAGTVQVTVCDADNSVIHGSCEITIRDIDPPASVIATVNGSKRAVQVQWSAGEGAAKYRVERADSQEGPFAEVGEVRQPAGAAAGDSASTAADASAASLLYADASVIAGHEYWYRVVPVGELDELSIDGIPSESAHVLFIDKTELHDAMARTNGLLNDESVKTSEDGRVDANGEPVFTDERWVPEATRTALADALSAASACYIKSSSSQVDIDEKKAALESMSDAFERAVAKGLVEHQSDPKPGKDVPEKKPEADNGNSQKPAGGTDTPQPSPAVDPSENNTPVSDPETPDAETATMLRLYNPNSGEHFYTADGRERDELVRAGWVYEGEGWTAPKSSEAPVYRMYNPVAGDHHYTTSARERGWLESVGWQYEGIGWYSAGDEATPLYRLYNPNASTGAHHYTTSPRERGWLESIGWVFEGIGWYAE